MRACTILADRNFLASEEFAELELFTERKLTAEFTDVLNDAHDEIVICGMTFLAGRALLRLDPVAFREMFNNWLDSESWVETEHGYVAGDALADAYEAFANKES